jgi:TatD DNase family protein
MRLVDTHCHLQSERYHEDREAVRERALARLDWVVVIGDDIASSEAAIALAGPRVFAAVGVHPYHAKDYTGATHSRLADLLDAPGVVALGEIGLDYFNEFSPRAAQAEAFERQLALACDRGYPVAIHNREADADCLAILRNAAGRLPGCVMHCFGSDAAFAEACVALGFYVSFAGNVTFPKAAPLREAAAAVPMERLLVETDAPYLAPVPLRGKRCEPQFVEHTAAFLAQLKGVEPEAFGAITTANAHALYRVPVDPAAA